EEGDLTLRLKDTKKFVELPFAIVREELQKGDEKPEFHEKPVQEKIAYRRFTTNLRSKARRINRKHNHLRNWEAYDNITGASIEEAKKLAYADATKYF